MELIKEIGAFAGLVAFLGLAVLALLSFSQGRDLRRLREWAGSAPERDSERKETTSAAAAQKAEEMRRLEEAKTAETEAAELREERRRRREEGLPEEPRAERIAAALPVPTGSRLGEPRVLAALFAVIVVAAGALGFVLLGGSDDDGSGGKQGTANARVNQGGGGGGGGDGGGGEAAPLPGDIEVTVLNGTAVPGLAATYGDMVEGKGFALGAVTNSTVGFAESAVMYEPGSAPEARRVASALGIAQVQEMTADIAAVSAGAPVAVVVGEDNASSAG